MKVLVAIDNKPASQAILDVLVKMHWTDGTEIYVLTVLPPAASRESDSELNEIEQLAVEIHDTLKQCEVYFLRPDGDPKTKIVETAASLKADMIITGSNCKNTLERLLLGSVCQSVLNAAHVPVLVAKTPCCLAREASPAFKNILIPIDNSIYSDLAISWLAKFNWAPDCRFILLAVVEEDTSRLAVNESLQKRAASLAGMLRTNNVFAEIVIGEPREAIIDVANKHYADLITIGSHGRSGIKKLILGNVAQSITHDAPCAVAVVRGLAPDEESWLGTGEFEKVKPVPVHALIQNRALSDDEDQLRPGVMPSGMG